MNIKDCKFTLYVCDTETTGFINNGPDANEIIELTLYRLNDDEHKTWFIKPQNYESIQADALRVNGHKIEDLKMLTKYGKDTYQDAIKVVADIENWMNEDGNDSTSRVMIGQNTNFDLVFMKNLWEKCNAWETFPFGPRPFILDTRQIALLIDLIKDERTEYYNLGSLVEKYGVKKEKSHRSFFDTKMTKDLLLAMVKVLSK